MRSSAQTATTAAANLTARNAVETVVKLAAAQAAQTEGGGHTVNLGFKFGEENLSVRVEMRDGQVHTQFSTDSNELRAAITSEWQSFSDSSSSRTFHFTDPVFTSGSGQTASFSPNSGDSAQRQQSQPESFGGTPVFAGGDSSPTDALVPAATAPVPSAVSTAQHLHTFA